MKRVTVALVAVVATLAAREASAACAGRPTDSGGLNGYDYGAAEVASFALTKVRVHYAKTGAHAPVLTSTRADGVPDSVAYAAETGETALREFAEWGYHAVPSDTACPSNGGDDKVDIYLVKFNGADGSTIVECNGGACSSFALVESTFKNRGYADAEEGFRTVVTHELFHAVQNTYKPGDASFWAEGTAQWAMKRVHPELADFERALPAFFAEPTRSLDAPPSGVTAGYLYGASVWPLFLSLRHGPDFIRSVYEKEETGAEPLPAIDELLKAKGSSLADEYPLFGAWNVGTKDVASTGGYPDAAKYPGVKMGQLADGLSAITSGLSYFAYRGKLSGEAAIALETDATRNGGVVVPFENGTLQLAKAKKLPANADGEVLVVVAGVTTKKSDAPFTIRFADPLPPDAETPDGGGASTGPGVDAPPAAGTSSGGDDGGCRSAPSSETPAGAAFLALLALVALGKARSEDRALGSRRRP
ncbi:MAG: hypothetical protein KIT84_14275 [Labilithrix sp.]|nr:hypothetical protein [Labilithrix sp.]MCW5812188.1 hypothetical protein [Labilithrix sp.]